MSGAADEMAETSVVDVEAEGVERSDRELDGVGVRERGGDCRSDSDMSMTVDGLTMDGSTVDSSSTDGSMADGSAANKLEGFWESRAHVCDRSLDDLWN